MTKILKKLKKRKGFTLVELLAVIVVLAIIALIGYSVVGDVITGTQESAHKESVREFAKSVSLAKMSALAKGETNIQFTSEWLSENVKMKGSNINCYGVTDNNGTISLSGCKVNDSQEQYCYDGTNVTKCNVNGIVKLYGESVQNGTPSPSNPVEIQSVGDVPNLLPSFTNKVMHGVTMSVANDGTITLNGTATGSDNFTISNVVIPAGNYTFCDFAEGDFPDVTAGTSPRVQLWDERNENSASITNKDNLRKCVQVNLTEATTFKYRVRIQTGHTYNNNKLRPMLINGTYDANKLSYAPPGKYGINIELSGKNIFDISMKPLNDTGKVVENGENYVIAQINEGNSSATNTSPGTANWRSGWLIYNILLDADKNYYLSYDIELLENTTTKEELEHYIYVRKDKTSLTQKKVIINKLNKKYHVSLNMTNKGANKIIFTLNSCKWKISNIQIEEGTIETEYEPYVEPITTNIYLDAPLRKVGDCENCADYIDFATGKLVRNIATTDTSNMQLVSFKDYSTLWFGYANRTLPGAINSSINKIQSDKFLTRYPRNVNNLGTSHLFNDDVGFPEVVYYNILKTDVPDVTDMAGLQEWFRNLDADIHYVLATSITTDIELPEIIKNPKPNYTKFKINTKVQPSKIDYFND